MTAQKLGNEIVDLSKIYFKAEVFDKGKSKV